jgi:hypothetical protein
MARTLTTKEGEPSWDGINPKLKKFCGYLFGYHKEENPCRCCGKYTHYALHRRYKWTSNLEHAISKETSSHNTWFTSEKEYDYKDRPWCCSDACFKKMVFEHTFDCIIPYEEAEKILLGSQ